MELGMELELEIDMEFIMGLVLELVIGLGMDRFEAGNPYVDGLGVGEGLALG